MDDDFLVSAESGIEYNFQACTSIAILIFFSKSRCRPVAESETTSIYQYFALVELTSLKLVHKIDFNELLKLQNIECP